VCKCILVCVCACVGIRDNRWSENGCVLVGVSDRGGGEGHVTCNCTHLTDFSSQLDATLNLAADVVREEFYSVHPFGYLRCSSADCFFGSGFNSLGCGAQVLIASLNIKEP